MFEGLLNLSEFNRLLATRVIGRASGFENEVWQSIDSTNTRALQLAKEGAPHGVVIAARHQSAGKGRLGRKWESPPDAGLYLSMLLRPQAPPAILPVLSFAAGVAAVDACEKACGLRPGLKWVNDIVSGGKKLGGILCEASAAMQETVAVVGIGINLRSLAAGGAPPDVVASAVSLEELLGAPVDANQLAAALVNAFERQYELLEKGDSQEIFARWKRSCVTLGREVRAIHGTTEIVGTARDIAADGALLIELPTGEQIALHAGDVSIRNADGTYA